MSEKYVCPSCGEPIDDPDSAICITHDDYIIPRKDEYDGMLMHESCFSDDLAEPIGSIEYITPNEKITVEVTPIFLYCDGFSELPTEIQNTILKIAESIKWHSTDPWRGYYDFDTPAGWIRTDSDWVPPFGGDSVGDAQIEKYNNAADKAEKTDEYIAVYLRTSNIFSTCYDFLVKEES